MLSLWLWYDGGCFSGLWSYLPLVFSEKVKRGLASGVYYAADVSMYIFWYYSRKSRQSWCWWWFFLRICVSFCMWSKCYVTNNDTKKWSFFTIPCLHVCVTVKETLVKLYSKSLLTWLSQSQILRFFLFFVPLLWALLAWLFYTTSLTCICQVGREERLVESHGLLDLFIWLIFSENERESVSLSLPRLKSWSPSHDVILPVICIQTWL